MNYVLIPQEPCFLLGEKYPMLFQDQDDIHTVCTILTFFYDTHCHFYLFTFTEIINLVELGI